MFLSSIVLCQKQKLNLYTNECYDKIENINRAIGSKNLNEVTDIYSSDIGWLISGNEQKVHSDIQNVLDKLKALI